MVEGRRRLAGDEEPMHEIPQPPGGEPSHLGEEHEEQPAKEPREGLEEASRKPVDMKDGKPEEGSKEVQGKPENRDGKPEGDEEDPFQELEDRGPDAIDEARLKQLDENNQRWRQFMADTEHQPVKSLTTALPIKSRRASEVIKATARVVARLRSLNIPIVRVHTDRAQEFCGRDFPAWLRARDLWHTTTAG